MDIFALGWVVTMVFAGGFLILWSYWNRKRAEASQGWPSIRGTVRSSKNKVRKHYDFETGQRWTTEKTKIIYIYKVNGRKYEGSRISFGSGIGAGSTGRQYPMGRSVTVHYKPENPRDAVLETNAAGTLWKILLGLITFGGAIALTLYQLTL